MLRKILKYVGRFEMWFNSKAGWFFTNGMKSGKL